MRMDRGLRRRIFAPGASIVIAIACTGCASFKSSPLEEARADALEKRQMASRLDETKEVPATPAEKLAAGDRFHREGREAEAMQAYLAAIRMDADSTRPKERIGFVQLGNDPERAEAIFARLIEENESNGTAWRGLGLAQLSQGDLDDSYRSLVRSLELEPDSAGARYALASTLGLMGRPQEALPHAERARELRPQDSHIANVLGMSYLLSDQPEKAEAVFRRVVQLVPRDATYSNNLGLALGAQGRHPEAYEIFLRVGSEQSARNNLGYTYYLVGQYDQAIAEYERALDAPGDDDVIVLRNLNAAVDAASGDSPAALDAD